MIIKQKLNISSNNYKELMNFLKGRSRLIGGCVRDAFLNKNTNDIDIATTLNPSGVIENLSKHKIKVLPTGIKHGTVSAFYKGEKFEITTLRKDISTDGRRADVLFTEDFESDASRRDFTINALSYCPFKEEIYDYFGGLEDLKNQKVIFIGNPKKRIKEDFLRILRFFRFSCFYAKEFDEVGVQSCRALKKDLCIISKERIKWELDKILSHKNSYITLKTMFDNEILPLLLPVNFSKLVLLRQAHDIYSEIITNLKSHDKAVINSCPPLPFLYSLILQEVNLKDLNLLKFSVKESKEILNYQDIKKVNLDQLTFKRWWLEKENYIEYIVTALLLDKAEKDQALDFIDKLYLRPRPIFPISGNDIKHQISGKEIKIVLNNLKNLWIKSDFTLSKEALLMSL